MTLGRANNIIILSADKENATAIMNNNNENNKQ